MELSIITVLFDFPSQKKFSSVSFSLGKTAIHPQ